MQEGSIKKFIKDVEQITFSAQNAIKSGQPVLYVTERAVFELTRNGLLLKEIAPGIDMQKDIIEQMDFVPTISDNVALMDDKLFRSELMNL